MSDLRRMGVVDGNALSGILAEVLRADATDVLSRCAHCGASAPLAEAVVELDECCAIARCRSCTHTLFTAMWDDLSVTLTIGGVDLRVPRTI